MHRTKKKEMKRKQRIKKEMKETSEKRKTEKGGEGEHLTGNIYTVYEFAGASIEEQRGRREEDERGQEEEST